jgi:hypothetical protein
MPVANVTDGADITEEWGDSVADAINALEPLGTKAYSSVTANQTGITSVTDLTGLLVTWTAVAGRRYKVTVTGEITATVGDGAYVVALTTSSNTDLKRAADACLTTSSRTFTLTYVEVPGAGSVTRKARLSKAGGTGTVGLSASSTNPAFILVEDIGV